MRILLAGQKRFGRDVLELLLRRGHEIAAVVCPVGTEPADKLFIAAQNHDLPVIKGGTLCAENTPAGVDLIVAAHSHDFIGRKTRLKARLGAIGYHPSLLPRHRGRSAVQWAIHMGERVTGGTVYWLNEVADGGPIAAQEFCLIKEGDTPRELWARELAPLGLSLFERVLAQIERGILVQLPQDPQLATWEPAMDKVPRLHRPDLELLGDGTTEGFRAIREKGGERSA
jgi:methionyl-tRNA formyltransferase